MDKTNLKPMNWFCRFGFHSFTDKPYDRTYTECWRCKSVLPGWVRIWKSEVETRNGYTYGAYTLERTTD